jgi:hypothetical protein
MLEYLAFVHSDLMSFRHLPHGLDRPRNTPHTPPPGTGSLLYAVPVAQSDVSLRGRERFARYVAVSQPSFQRGALRAVVAICWLDVLTCG